MYMNEERAMFTGSIVALITPFRDGEVDEAALERLVRFQIDGGTRCISPCGTTGESPTLTPEEHERVVRLTVEMTRSYGASTGHARVPIIAGAGSNSTAEAIHYSRAAQRDGADGLLHVTPYYNRPTQEGLYQHFAAIATATDLPIILYNVPSRTGANLLPETVERLARIPNIVGIKEASGILDQSSEIRRRCDPDFVILSGDDSLTLPILSVGGNGVISVVANIAPDRTAALVDAWERGDVREAQRRHLELFDVARAMFVETNPGPVKAAAELLGLCQGEPRLPLVRPTAANLTRIQSALETAGILGPVGVPA
jgi:4-hydroxy-tetrahydrodipicolinate synthase